MKKINPVLIFFAVGLVLLFTAGNVMGEEDGPPEGSTQLMSSVDGTFDEAGNGNSQNSYTVYDNILERLFGTLFDNTARTLSISGQKAAFQSQAEDLVEKDTNGNWDVYVRDAVTGMTSLVSVGLDGYAGTLPFDIDGLLEGRDLPFDPDDFIPFTSRNPAISQNGQYVAFDSMAGNLIPMHADDENHYGLHVFRRDVVNNKTVRVSVDPYGYGGDCFSWNPSISADGKYVAFQSGAGNLLREYEDEWRNTWLNVFRHNVDTGETELVNVTPDGVGGEYAALNPSLSHDGTHVAFDSWADDLVDKDTNERRDVFIRNMSGGTTTLVSADYQYGYGGNYGSSNPSTSGNGRYVAFESFATDLVPNEHYTTWWRGTAPWGNFYNQIYLRDTSAGTTILVSMDRYGYGGDGGSHNPSISSDGRYVAFESDANYLVEGDTNGLKDIFVYDSLTGTITRVNISSEMEPTMYEDSNRPSISPDGRFVSFDTAEVSDTKQVLRNDYFDQNGDGVRDGQEVDGVTNTPQDVTVKSYTGTGAVQVQTGTNATITFVESVDPVTALQDTRSADGGTVPTSIPCGLVSFNLNVAVGATVQVEITFPCTLGSTAYYKYGPEGWIVFSDSSKYPGAVSISGNTVTLTLTDGGAGDLDGVANGVIVDPSGPGVSTASAGNDSGGGCFIGTLAN